jgi:hypothetical protein
MNDTPSCQDILDISPKTIDFGEKLAAQHLVFCPFRCRAR